MALPVSSLVLFGTKLFRRVFFKILLDLAQSCFCLLRIAFMLLCFYCYVYYCIVYISLIVNHVGMHLIKVWCIDRSNFFCW